ncbi:MAG: glycosyltransferase [Candidatus Pacebacteria bacterium]|nr:glycosyltransferase [Candidatus Paceibacterota bacterium]
MRIGMFINYFTPSKGGMETSVINLSNGLRAAGHEVFIFAPDYPDWEEKEENIFRYKSFSFTYDDYLYVIPVPMVSKMEDTVRSLNLDVIHSHQPFSLGWEATKFSRKLDIPIVLTYHIKYEDYSHYVFLIPKKISQKIIRWIVNHNCRKCDALIAPSGAIKKLLFEQGIKKSVHIIPSGINIDQFAKDAGTRDSIRNKYDIKENEVFLITASRVVPEKNIDFLVRAFAIIRNTRKDVRLMIVGEGSFRDELDVLVKELELEDSVIFTGLLDKEEMIAHYQASDIFVFASLTETQGLVAVEAMAAGLPVVAVKASGIEDMIKSGQDGILTDNVEDNFATNTIKLIEDGALRKKMSASARVNAREFCIAPWVDKVVGLYNEIIQKKKNE